MNGDDRKFVTITPDLPAAGPATCPECGFMHPPAPNGCPMKAVSEAPNDELRSVYSEIQGVISNADIDVKKKEELAQMLKKTIKYWKLTNKK